MTEQSPDTLDVLPSLKRRLAAVAFADVAGYSRLIAANDVETVRRWKALRSDLIEPLMARHGGRIAEIAGDALLVEFSSVVNAVRWAAQVQRAQYAVHDKSDPFALRLRVGINVDDVIDDDGILQGDGVNIAARIHQAGEPGQIVVTSRVREYVINRLPLKFRDLGTPPMKNIAQPVRVFAIDWLDADEPQLLPQPYLHWTSRPTLAVLPLRNTGSPGDAYFGEGITEEIISALSRNRAIYVIARTSTLRYVGHPTKDLRQIAGELDVRYVLHGSVQRQDTNLRITVELFDITGGQTLLSQRFSGSTDKIFEFQDRIAASIIGSLEPRVLAVESARASERPTDSLDAYDCVLKTMSLLYRFTDESYRETEVLLERAVQLDPSYARAHAYLAWRLNFVFGEGRSKDAEADRAKALACSLRALELDPDDPFVLSVAGHLQAFVGRDIDGASELFDRALTVDENSAFAWGLSALTLSYLGRPDEALERLQNLWRLNPYDPLNFYFWIVAGIAEFVAGRYHEAITWTRKSRRANPRFIAALRTLAPALALSGDEKGAKAIGAEILALEPNFRVSTFVSWYPLRRQEDLGRLADGLRAAGLPD